MGLFKTKKDAAEFSRDFYEKYLFGPKIRGIDPVAAYAETVHRTISNDDAIFSAVQLPKLKDELLGLQLEMIGTAWTHKSKESAAIVNSDFTKKYLADKGRSDLWEIMGEYNQRVATSATFGMDPDSRLGRATRVFVNTRLIQTFDTWNAKGIYDKEAIGRVAGRLVSDTKSIFLLVANCAIQRFEIEGTKSILEKLGGVAFGFYQGAKDSLNGVRLAA